MALAVIWGACAFINLTTSYRFAVEGHSAWSMCVAVFAMFCAYGAIQFAEGNW